MFLVQEPGERKKPNQEGFFSSVLERRSSSARGKNPGRGGCFYASRGKEGGTGRPPADPERKNLTRPDKKKEAPFLLFLKKEKLLQRTPCRPSSSPEKGKGQSVSKSEGISPLAKDENAISICLAENQPNFPSSRKKEESLDKRLGERRREIQAFPQLPLEMQRREDEVPFRRRGKNAIKLFARRGGGPVTISIKV